MLSAGEWDAIVDNLASGNTVVCLGPELFVQDGQTLDAQLNTELQALDHVYRYADGLFHFKGAGDMTSYTKIKQFYQRNYPALDGLLAQLASLPAAVFVSTTPDALLKKAFLQHGFSFQYAFHYPNRPAQELHTPTRDKPLIYNLLGDVERRESLVLTHEDLFGFLESLMEGKSVSLVLKEYIQQAYNFLFIGLPFQQWYMKVLVHFLQRDANRKALRYAANQAFDAEVQSFMIDQFQITCVPTRIADFVGELHQRCTQAGHIRSVEKSEQLSLIDVWLLRIKHDELRELVEDLMSYFEGKTGISADHENLLFTLSGRLANVERMVQRGTLPSEDILLQRNQIRDALFELVQAMGKALGL